MNKKKVKLFLLINFGISWLVGFIGVASGIKVFTRPYLILAVVYMFFPGLSVIIVKKIIYKENILKPLHVSFKINKWFFVAWMIPILIAVLCFGVVLFFPGVEYAADMGGYLSKYKTILSPEQFSQLENQLLNSSFPPVLIIIIQVLFAGLTINAVAGFGEELGWRGLLYKELIDMGFWKSSMTIGFLWGIWHLPLILMGHNYPNHPLIGIIIMTCIGTLLGPIFSFIRLKSGSVIAASICHGTFNASLPLATLFIKGGNDILVGMTGIAGIIALLILNLLLYFNDQFIDSIKMEINGGEEYVIRNE